LPDVALPERFTFPFQYEPHPFALTAAAELQQYLQEQQSLHHNFGLETDREGVVYGKMFGVLVVQHNSGTLGYLAAFSGKLGGKNHHEGFVPPVFDILDEQGFYRKGEAELNQLNRRIEALEQDPALAALQALQAQEMTTYAQQLAAVKQQAQAGKADRKRRREEIAGADAETLKNLEATLVQESLHEHYLLKDLKKTWKTKLESLENQANTLLEAIRELKETRRQKSADLQQHIFDHYYFLNRAGTQKSLADIFQRNAATPPPAGAGECAAPKLLQYAFLHQLKPLVMAEFWWGESPTGEVRKHGHYYPACRGKCAPILAHMLEGMPLDDNPMQAGQSTALELPIVYEDEALVVVVKPADLLSVPGKNELDSVFFRMKQRYPEADGPLVVHRLDMGTSGLMLVAKTAAVHKALQSQFIQRTIKKRYVAILDGVLEGDSGVIDLPLRVDLDDRPRQMVCYTYGKSARTTWQVVARTDQTTRIHFFPVTGRTHQLRVHAAHPLGLNMPIVGDELYGIKGSRLHLHAEWLTFEHPLSRETVELCHPADF
jgi:tRNA pseudouridine32 synthase / 23S rRNA pseudouridine746 synthase